MQSKIIEPFKQLIVWIESLRDVNDLLWTTPIAPGKWSVQGIVSHIMLWDKYFLENAIEPIGKNGDITIEDLDFDDFNKKAEEYGRTQSKEDLIYQTIQYRNQIISNLMILSDEDYFKEYPNFSVPQYIADFVAHDNHHIEQIEDFLRRQLV